MDQSVANRRGGARGIVFRSYCHSSSPNHQGFHPRPRYSTLPSRIAPPLLPLPIPTHGIAMKPQRKPRSGFNSRKEQRSRREDVPGIVAHRRPVEMRDDEEEEEMVFDGSLYSISPPPSSLPLPRFSMAKPKPGLAPASCVVEAIGSGGGIDAGATDDLRRLLRL